MEIIQLNFNRVPRTHTQKTMPDSIWIDHMYLPLLIFPISVGTITFSHDKTFSKLLLKKNQIFIYFCILECFLAKMYLDLCLTDMFSTYNSIYNICCYSIYFFDDDSYDCNLCFSYFSFLSLFYLEII